MKYPPAIARPVAPTAPAPAAPAPRERQPQPKHVIGAAVLLAIALLGGSVLVVLSSGRLAGIATSRVSPAPATGDPLASVAFTCSGSTGVGVSGAPPVAYINGVGVSRHSGFERVTIGFANGRPGDVVVSSQDSAVFAASGASPVTLLGKFGALLTIDGGDGHTRYSGRTDLKTGYSTVLELRQIHDSGGMVQWAIGLSHAGCDRVAIYDHPVALVVDFKTS